MDDWIGQWHCFGMVTTNSSFLSQYWSTFALLSMFIHRKRTSFTGNKLLAFVKWVHFKWFETSIGSSHVFALHLERHCISGRKYDSQCWLSLAAQEQLDQTRPAHAPYLCRVRAVLANDLAVAWHVMKLSTCTSNNSHFYCFGSVVFVVSFVSSSSALFLAPRWTDTVQLANLLELACLTFIAAEPTASQRPVI